jgi:hypothetical protein
VRPDPCCPAVARPSSTLLGAMAHAAEQLRVTLLPVVVEGEEQFVAAFAAIGRDRADALIVEENGPASPTTRRPVRGKEPTAGCFRVQVIHRGRWAHELWHG